MTCPNFVAQPGRHKITKVDELARCICTLMHIDRAMVVPVLVRAQAVAETARETARARSQEYSRNRKWTYSIPAKGD
jgi:hypothetical protein